MTTTPPHRCDYIPLESPSIFAEQFTDLAHIDERLFHLDNHIQQLHRLRLALVYRSNQLHSPSYKLPFEVLSHIFQELVPEFPVHHVDHYDTCQTNSAHHVYYYDTCRTTFRQGFILSAVSKHFRQTALGTPQLWERIRFQFSTRRSFRNCPRLLEHCASHAHPRVLAIDFSLVHKVVPTDDELISITSTLFSPAFTRNIHALELDYLPPWLSLPPLSSTFPVLNTVNMSLDCNDPTLDLRPLHLSGVTLSGDSGPVFLPPSIQYLATINLTISESLLYQCSNLVECFIDVNQLLGKPGEDLPPITLCRLKRLTCEITSFSLGQFPILIVRDLRTPSLEYLKIIFSSICFHSGDASNFVLQLGHKISSTLVSLTLYGLAGEHDTFRMLFRLPWPNLQYLKIYTDGPYRLVEVIQALTPEDNEYKNQPEGVKYFPKLDVLDLDCAFGRENLPRTILDMLKKTNFGLVRDFLLVVPCNLRGREGEHRVWPPEWLEELTSIVNSRRLEWRWGQEHI